MENNMVQNPKTEVPGTIEMNDRDYINDVLESEKNLSNNLSIVLNEASNEALYQDILTIFNDTQTMARRLYAVMFQKGWYALEKAEVKKINQKYNEYSSRLSELP